MKPDNAPPMKLRVLIQQPALPSYRIPVFTTLSARSGIDLVVRHGDRSLSPTVEADGFKHELCRDREVGPRSMDLRWSPAQWSGSAAGACDVLVLEWNLRVLSLIPSMLRARMNGIGVVLWGHGRSRRANMLRRGLRNLLGVLGDSIVVYSHNGKRFVVESGFKPERVYVALNTQDQTPIQEARADWLSRPEDLRRFQEQEGVADRPVLLFSSTLMVDKRCDLLLDATALLVQRGLNPIAIIIGDGPLRGELTAKAQGLGISQNVRFLGSVYGEPAIAPWFLSATVFCHPRTIGLSILHAFGYGVPVVTSDDMASHHPEIGAFVDGQTGLFYKDQDAGSLADVLRQLIEDDELRRKCGIEARRVATQDFTIPNMVNGLEQAIRNAVRHGAMNPAISK